MSEAGGARRALVTGGSGDLGGAICRALAAQGVEVIVHANGQLGRAQALAEELLGAGGFSTAPPPPRPAPHSRRSCSTARSRSW
jgi:3-oxoacyl-[acyl-carrier protein] reductase